jgi:hypothetical protein
MLQGFLQIAKMDAWRLRNVLNAGRLSEAQRKLLLRLVFWF